MASTLTGYNNSASKPIFPHSILICVIFSMNTLGVKDSDAMHQCVTQTHCFKKTHFGYLYIYFRISNLICLMCFSTLSYSFLCPCSVPFYIYLNVGDKFGTATYVTTNILCFLHLIAVLDRVLVVPV